MSQRPEIIAGVEDVDLTGTTALVTGATSGIGRETALALGRLGADVIVHGRDPNRGRAVTAALRRLGGEPIFLRADFTDMAAVRELVSTVRDRVDRLALLVHNAGAHFHTGALTADGTERTFAVNHLAPFLLTNRLRPMLPNDSRIITVASAVHRRADASDLERDQLTSVDGYDGFTAYARSKLANVLFTRALAERLDGPTANCLHPGFVPDSGLWRAAPVYVRAAMGALSALPGPIARLAFDTPATGAATVVFLAASPSVADLSGRYFADCEPVTPSATARNDDLAARVWEMSAQLLDCPIE